jgi:HD-GYP domain-containing protein (c-di-GMP phosphodiesterase class II)
MRATELLARALDLPAEDRETLRLAVLLHDVGMLAVPAAVLNKHTPLTPAELDLIRRHPQAAAEWLARVPALVQVASVVRHHHERYDGRGYPDGLRGEQTSLLARVLAIADAYASMTSDWPGRPALAPHQSRAEIQAGAGSQFDPQLAERFLQALAGEQP